MKQTDLNDALIWEKNIESAVPNTAIFTSSTLGDPKPTPKMRKVGIRKLLRNFRKEILDLPVIVTRHRKIVAVILPPDGKD